MSFSFPHMDASVASWAIAIGLGVLGGLILNLMPCVLPVLSIKLTNVAGKAGKSRREIRLGFLASSAGILFTFAVLAAALIAAKAAGLAIGWGVQFQHPLFLVALALICVLFTANLWGLFEIGLPGFVGSGIGHGTQMADSPATS